ncbi:MULTISPECIES: hypothetical protein [unclassified Streptomyces]|uniref:hypothetical protein n=1 Tax=unclassified Streptomyces TaxID=2593676 RepID=UPI002DDC76D2|nr:hypothetical protein [Streptomyces sp. NBC_01775]WSB79994.1 hypothetical protein OHB04_32550 [Streptomyces sp. NBC_01775]WSS40512.1 hypothetical protein OG220_07815 [Streptomyces sp. NBC_01187]
MRDRSAAYGLTPAPPPGVTTWTASASSTAKPSRIWSYIWRALRGYPGPVIGWTAIGRDAEGRDTVGRDAVGRDAVGRDASGRDASGEGRPGARRPE